MEDKGILEKHEAKNLAKIGDWIMYIASGFIQDWKAFGKNKKKLVLLILFNLFLPAPCFYFAIAGLIPSLFSFMLGFFMIPTVAGNSLRFILLLICLSFLHLIILTYIYRFLIYLIFRIANIISSKKYIDWSITILISIAIIWIAFYKIYWVGDAGGGEHKYNIIDLISSYK